MRYILTGLLLLILSPSWCQFDQLNQTIAASPKYDSAKIHSIQQLKTSSSNIKDDNLPARFDATLCLYESYKVFNYDSAFTYARQLQELARQLGDPNRITYARVKMGFCLLSAGMFKETLDSLNKIDVHTAPDSIQAEYYSLMGRYYYDLGDFDNDRYNTPAYTQRAGLYIDSALALYPQSSFSHSYYKGLKELKDNKP
ncbi:MAG: tetratricopeptide repeat protein, partial [Bacteroidetes bacterium]|nr:tetratricopeptide repeat protein [Bacteroidota bacterium]